MAKISHKKLTDLCHRVGTAYSAGLDVKKIWTRESAHGSPAHKQAMRKVAETIIGGDTVANGMRAAEGYFPELAIAVTEAGESGGRMDRSFELLKEHYESLLKFRRDMMAKLAWPIMELTGAIVIIGVFIIVMSWVAQINNGNVFDVFGLGWTYSQYFWTYVALITFMVICSGLVFFGAKAGWFGELPMRVARRIPLIGKTIQIFSLARFAWVLSAVFESGMNTMRGVSLAFRSTQNFYYEKFEEPVKEDLQTGMELTQSLRKTEAFPEDFLMHVESGELTGQLPESMERVAREYTLEAENNLQIISKILFMIVFGCVAVVIAFAVIRLFMSYLGVLNDVANGI